jgi:crotonobetaine/carnitine-CoA ligase
MESVDVAQLLERRAVQDPPRLLLAWEPFEGAGREWTREAFLHDVQATAGGLAARGVRRGDRVLLACENCPELLLTWFACAWLGAVCVVLNPKSSADEMGYSARHTGACGLVVQQGLPLPAGESTQLQWHVVVDGPSGAPDAFEHLLCAATVPRTDGIDPLEPGSMLFTSGTTSRPKAVVWSRGVALWAAESVAAAARLTPDDVVQVFVPLYHVVGLAWSVLPALHGGAAVVLQPRFSASRFWPVAAQRKATFASHVQFSSGVLSRQPVPQQHGFRLWGNSTWLPDYERHFSVPLLGWWGMTELVAPGSVGTIGQPQQPGTIGRAASGYRLRIAGAAADLQPGDVGELEVLGEPGRTLFSGYFGDEVATREAFTADGWFRTGDRVRVHADGSIQFLERARDVIKTGGEGVSPAEVERVIRGVAGVADVSLVGRPDPAYGEVGVAFVVAAGQDTALLRERILAVCREMLAPFKVPREIRFVDALPLAGIAKVAKGELRRRAALPPDGPSCGA